MGAEEVIIAPRSPWQSPFADWIKGARVALDSIIYQFQQGRSPEVIQDAFSTLSLSQVYVACHYPKHVHLRGIDDNLKDLAALYSLVKSSKFDLQSMCEQFGVKQTKHLQLHQMVTVCK